MPEAVDSNTTPVTLISIRMNLEDALLSVDEQRDRMWALLQALRTHFMGKFVANDCFEICNVLFDEMEKWDQYFGVAYDEVEKLRAFLPDAKQYITASQEESE